MPSAWSPRPRFHLATVPMMTASEPSGSLRMASRTASAASGATIATTFPSLADVQRIEAWQFASAFRNRNRRRPHRIQRKNCYCRETKATCASKPRWTAEKYRMPGTRARCFARNGFAASAPWSTRCPYCSGKISRSPEHRLLRRRLLRRYDERGRASMPPVTADRSAARFVPGKSY